MDLRNAVLLAESVRTGRLRARDVVEAALERIDSANEGIFAYLSVEAEKARSRAESVDRAVAEGRSLPLAGVPVAIKDNICTKGIRTTCGSRILDDFIPPYSATAVGRLENAGAVVVGKTNCDEFAMGSSTENSSFGVTRNPHDPSRVPGGSSGGSAAAVAAGTVPLALGSDTGGSVRQPASFCGVVGLKPTYGRISRYGLVAFASSLDVIGVLANSAADAALLLSVVAGHDEKDATSATAPVPEYQSWLSTPLRGLRIGIPREFFAEGLDAEVRDIIDGAIRDACALGCEAVDVSLPHTPYAIADYYIIAPAEASSNLARYDGVRYGYRAAQVRELLEMYTHSRTAGFGAEVRRRIMVGTYALSAGYYEAYYGRAMKVRTLIKHDYDEALNRVDVLFSPVSPTPAFGIGEKASDPLAMYLSDIYTVTANLAGIPGISVPVGKTASGLPVGLQVLGRAFDEQTLLRVAHKLMPASPAFQIPEPAHE